MNKNSSIIIINHSNHNPCVLAQVLDSVSVFEVKSRDEHWSVMGACAELMMARM